MAIELTKDDYAAVIRDLSARTSTAFDNISSVRTMSMCLASPEKAETTIKLMREAARILEMVAQNVNEATRG